MNRGLIVLPVRRIQNDVRYFVLEICITRTKAQLLWHPQPHGQQFYRRHDKRAHYFILIPYT
jgi:hypothetical protein